MSVTCKIDLHKEDATYTTGEDVEGTVTVTITDHDDIENFEGIKDIIIILQGWSKCTYEKMRDNGNKVSYGTYESKIKFMNEKVFLLSTEVLMVGTYTYPFKFSIPEKCLASLDHESLHVGYELALDFSNKGKCKHVCALKSISVKKPVTKKILLDMDGKIQHKSIDNETVVVNVHHEFIIPRCGYVSGEVIKYKLDVTKQESYEIPVKYYKITFSKNIQYSFDVPVEYTKLTDEILYTKFIQVENVEPQIFSDEIPLPALPPTTRADNFNVYYLLSAECCLNIDSCSRYFVLKEIVIGSMPEEQTDKKTVDEGVIKIVLEKNTLHLQSKEVRSVNIPFAMILRHPKLLSKYCLRKGRCTLNNLASKFSNRTAKNKTFV